MKNMYPTFPNPAGIGSGMGYENPSKNQPHIIPEIPHPQIILTPQPGQPDPVLASQTEYNQMGFPNPWDAMHGA